MELTIDTPADELTRRRIADLETLVEHLELRLASLMAERDRLARRVEELESQRG